ncbi:unnamed protein product [Absidia cylindrospora]
MTATSSSYQTDTIYYPKSNYLTSTKIMEPASSTSLSRTQAYSVFSPPELVHDDEEEDEEDPTPLPASPPTTPPSCLIMNQHRILKNSISAPPITKRRKCIPHRSPSLASSNDWIFTWPSPTTSTTHASQSIRFIPQQEQQYLNYSYQPKIVYLRHRKNSDSTLKSSPSISLKSPSVPLSSSPSSLLPTQSAFTPMVTSNSDQYTTPPPSQSTTRPLPLPPMISIHPQQPEARIHADVGPQNDNTAIATAFSSGRPIRLKGPCQACHENSEACMRKAFNWPFPSDEVYYDKGRPFVYLCNKCGLRYNKSGGSVCRQCRWVLCKEEKRKVIQLIDAMRSSRSDGQVSLDEDILSFVCTPKYWNCGQPWKIRWAVNDLVDIDDKQ